MHVKSFAWCLATINPGITGCCCDCCYYLQLQNQNSPYFTLMLFSGMCLLKISWEFIKNSMAEQSSPKKPLLTVHTFSSWKCKCNWWNICKCFIVTSLTHFPMLWLPECGYWIYGFGLFKFSCMIVDTCCWNFFFIHFISSWKSQLTV